MKLDVCINRAECQAVKGVHTPTPNPTPTPTTNAMNLITRDALRNALMKLLDLDYSNVSSCTSAVIDAKIERAMDMSHSLMYAMQEEVEVLNKQIVVLVDRIKQLEVENAFLKSNASPDVLRALNTGTAPLTSCCIGYEKEMQTEDLEVAAITANGVFGVRY